MFCLYPVGGSEAQGERGNPQKWFAIDAETDVGKLVTFYNTMDANKQARLLGYAEGLRILMEKDQ